ncbi:recombinase family protein [Geothrix campi]|uniref:recombinase family protein n=1 Tax=Geothrix campi TaxID=2966450 RepID=UPI0021477247|nr:recombinase family protein [Geothrix sp. SG10]
MVESRPKQSSKAVGYTRVSTIDQANHGVSLEAQAEKIRAWCALSDYELADIHVDRGLSGGRADNRPALQAALQSIKKGDALVVYSLSRLARSASDSGTILKDLQRRGADLVSLTERIDTTSPSGKLVFTMMSGIHEFERDVISERTKLAMHHLQSLRRFIGGGVPYGFQLKEDRVWPFAPEMVVIAWVNRSRLEGMSLRAIAAELAAEGIYSRTGRPFNPAQLHRMLKIAPKYFTGDDPGKPLPGSGDPPAVGQTQANG